MFFIFRGWVEGCLAFCPLGGGIGWRVPCVFALLGVGWDGGCLVFLLFRWRGGLRVPCVFAL